MTRCLVGTYAAAGILALAASTSADVITLKGGAVIEGTVLKRSDTKVWVDVGPEVLSFSVDDIDRVEVAEPPSARVEAESLYHTATDLPLLSPLEQAKRVGPAVIKVATPPRAGVGRHH